MGSTLKRICSNRTPIEKGVGGGRERKRLREKEGMTVKLWILNIECMPINPNAGFFFKFSFVCVYGGGGGGVSRLSREVGAIVFICDTQYQPYTHCFKFPSTYFMELPSYDLNKSSLINLSKGCNSKKIRQ